MQVKIKNENFDFESDVFKIWKVNMQSLIRCAQKNDKSGIEYYINQLFLCSLNLNTATEDNSYIWDMETEWK